MVIYFSLLNLDCVRSQVISIHIGQAGKRTAIVFCPREVGFAFAQIGKSIGIVVKEQ